uniref:Uncharacterized protein n=1 Tax=Rhizophora mucronata TaxID=61149 RepID=A0A2P2NEN7_RHIMU
MTTTKISSSPRITKHALLCFARSMSLGRPA